MNALENIQEKNLISTRKKNNQPFVVEPSRSFFKVVVNNYKQHELFFDKKEIDEMMIEHHQCLPPQPTGYLKCPEYDWF